jgi:hypothetical protein
VVKTGQGQFCRILATPALRKTPDSDAAPVPVLVLERFDTFEPGKSSSRLARGAGLILFHGFQVDLDIGQVVPEGQGGDLTFVASEGREPVLKTLGKSQLFTPTRPLPVDTPSTGPTPGKQVVPSDFSGRYRLSADGRWSGLLELRVGADRQVTGRFRSEPNGSSYPLTGQVSAETPHKLTFSLKFPRTEQEYQAYLATEGKEALAGTFTMQERTFGFFALREGSKVEKPEE